MEISPNDSQYEFELIRISTSNSNASYQIESRNPYHKTMFAGIDGQGSHVLIAIPELNLSAYNYLDFDLLIQQNNGGGNAYIGITSTANLSTGTVWYTDLTNYVSTSCAQTGVNHLTLDLSTIDKNNLKNARIYFKVYSAFNSGGIWASPLKITAYN